MKIHKGKDVLEIIKQPSFLQSWDRLARQCPWATVFQQKEFVLTWYELFDDQTPIIITDWNGDSMTGIFPLIQTADQLSYPGNNLAEYQAWLSTKENNTSFIKGALDLIRNDYSLHLKYLPSESPLDWLDDHSRLKKHIFLKEYAQPIMECNEERLDIELKKKNKKEKINRLKRQGELSFQRITSPTDFTDILPQLIEQNEFRKGAIYGKLAFLDDHRRVDFLDKVFEKGLLHASILKLNNEIIASNVGFITGNTVHLQGLNTHSPFYAKHSPGILHFLMLGIDLKKDNFDYFDLTPGGIDGYKSKLATSYYSTHELQMDSVFETKKKQVKDSIKSTAKNLIGKKPKKPTLLSTLFFGSNKGNPSESQHKAIYFNLKGDQFNIKTNQTSVVESKSNYTYHKNNIADLLIFPLEEQKIAFLSDAMYRIENGQHFYAVKSAQLLIATLWFIPTGTKEMNGNKREQDNLEFSYLSPSLESPQEIINTIIQDEHLSPSLVSSMDISYFKFPILE
ncbi:hypothetical protein DN752_21555 [Echinicola strongylocentroti]|uniref:BioF2-like acetyltransferase domain-containing protein n=1 Tax=Echinicola strongylocentroti TaxID=1795355 RepID=A0A2Z4IPP1_9BACT|nr:GNAT family N-acetyltransferase [Echinicola strongylocentroti]AWW32526.1 hypothetical protein DN752_21555 [Echinicola strongylocentroti]